MYKIIGADGKEYGPVTTEQLRDWITQGRANAQTQVRPEGDTDWIALGALPEFADAAGTATAPPPLMTVALSVDEMAARDYRLEIGSCIGRGWELLKANVGLLVGGTVLVMLAQMAVGILPFLGLIAQLILGGALTGGMYWLFIRAIRGESGGVGDAFAGFSRGFAQLMLGHIVPQLLILLIVFPVAFAFGLGVGLSSQRSGTITPLFVIAGVLLAVGLPFMIYFSVCWFFTLPLIIDKQIDFWPAMKLSRSVVRKHWWSVFGLLFVSSLVAAAGLLACIVGILFTGPIAIGAMMYAYEDMFGSARSAA